MDLQGKAADYSHARVVVLPAPYEATCSYGMGTSRGPEAILKASVAAEFYDEELRLEIDRIGIATLPPPAIESLKPSAMVKAVYEMTRPVVQAGKIPAGLGGEHTVTLGFLQAVAEKHTKLSVLQIDAHPDLRDAYEGRRICHATVGRRIMEQHPLVQVGLRAFSREEMDLLEAEASSGSGQVRPFSAAWIHSNPEWIESVVSALGEHVYISLDLDGLDPSLLPHTGTPEPNGLSWRQVCDLLVRVNETRNIAGFDIVELAPDSTSRVSDFTAARLCLRMIGLCATPNHKRKPLPF
ncbi:MAG: agmatinase [bacterium]